MSGEVNIGGTVTPAAGDNTFPIVKDINAFNGCRVVANHAARNAISSQLLTAGALVLVVDSDGANTFKAYRYLGTSPASDGNWTEFASSPGGGVKWTPANATARQALTVATSDIDSMAFQLDTQQLWVALAAGTGATPWVGGQVLQVVDGTLTYTSGTLGVTQATATPTAIGTTTGAVGTSAKSAREDHAHACTYGTAANTVCQGNDSRLSDARTPTGSATGDLAGTYPAPTVYQAHLTDQAAPAAPASGTLVLASFNQQGFSVPHVYDHEGHAIEITRDNIVIVRNNTGSTINKGQVVYINGSTGTVSTVALAKADSTTTIPVYGVMYETTANNSFGRMLVAGALENFDTSAFAAGDTLYLSATTAGGMVNSVPSTGYVQKVGVVIASSVGAGSILVTSRSVIGSGATPQALGTAAAGTSAYPARDNHVHSSFTSATLLAGGSALGSGVSEQTGSVVAQSTGSSTVRGIVAEQYSTDTNGARFIGIKARGTAASPTTAASGDNAMKLVSLGYDGTSYIASGSLTFKIDAAVSTGVVPQAIELYTGNSGTPTLRFSISSAGVIDAQTNKLTNIGDASATTDAASYQQTYKARITSISSNVTLSCTGEINMVDTSSARTLTLPDPAGLGTCIIKDKTGTAYTNNITIARHGSEKIENVAAGFVINGVYSSIFLWSDGTDWWISGIAA